MPFSSWRVALHVPSPFKQCARTRTEILGGPCPLGGTVGEAFGPPSARQEPLQVLKASPLLLVPPLMSPNMKPTRRETRSKIITHTCIVPIIHACIMTIPTSSDYMHVLHYHHNICMDIEQRASMYYYRCLCKYYHVKHVGRTIIIQAYYIFIEQTCILIVAHVCTMVILHARNGHSTCTYYKSDQPRKRSKDNTTDYEQQYTNELSQQSHLVK